jgi:adenine phosphoribosyltransferase
VPDLKQYVTETHDFPKPGVLFRDFSPLLRHHLRDTLDALQSLLDADEWRDIDVVVGVDARGFMLGAALAAHRGVGFASVRKGGKLPPPVQQLSYDLEYGSATLEIHPGSGRALLVDDILATGGTLGAAARLCNSAGYDLKAIMVLADLGLRSGPIEGLPVRTLLRYGP